MFGIGNFNLDPDYLTLNQFNIIRRIRKFKGNHIKYYLKIILNNSI
jgi:hypothetical protein